MAAAFAVAILLSLPSCDKETESFIDFEQTPVQVIHDMNVLQTENGETSMRMHAPLMQKFEYVKDSLQQSYEYYPEGFFVDAYTENGELETSIVSQQAKHITTKDRESWSAFGNVVIINHLKGEKIETDTLYWNRAEKKIYTDCYVRLSSDSGLMQGYGMTSDERARNSVILRPFDSYAIERDSTYAYNDTVNFVGPRKK